MKSYFRISFPGSSNVFEERGFTSLEILIAICAVLFYFLCFSIVFLNPFSEGEGVLGSSLDSLDSALEPAVDFGLIYKKISSIDSDKVLPKQGLKKISWESLDGEIPDGKGILTLEYFSDYNNPEKIVEYSSWSTYLISQKLLPLPGIEAVKLVVSNLDNLVLEVIWGKENLKQASCSGFSSKVEADVLRPIKKARDFKLSSELILAVPALTVLVDTE